MSGVVEMKVQTAALHGIDELLFEGLKQFGFDSAIVDQDGAYCHFLEILEVFSDVGLEGCHILVDLLVAIIFCIGLFPEEVLLIYSRFTWYALLDKFLCDVFMVVDLIGVTNDEHTDL